MNFTLYVGPSYSAAGAANVKERNADSMQLILKIIPF